MYVPQPVFLPAGRSRALVYVKCTLATTTDQKKTTTTYFFVYYLGWEADGIDFGYRCLHRSEDCSMTLHLLMLAILE